MLWKKNYDVDKEILKFTVGNDHIMDKRLVEFDCIASKAHAKMLGKTGILSKEEVSQLVSGLDEIEKNGLDISMEQEDCHTAIEEYLTKKYGNVGKKIHVGRSRNDQVLAALRLYHKSSLNEVKSLLKDFKKSLSIKDVPFPGYTHMQRAMPTSTGVWIGSFADSVDDNLKLLDSVMEVIDQSPLGTGAGFGVPVFKIDRKMTAKEMGFSKVQENPFYTQLSRGKFEAAILSVLTQIMFDLNKLATDLMVFSMKEFGFISLPKEFCTGSSMMPQKKNPDVLELMRAKYHVVLGEEFKVKSMISNLISGFNRDMQLTKEPVFVSFDITKDCLKIMTLLLSKVSVNEEKCKAAMTKELYATEDAYKLVKKGIPFRDAYKQVGKKYS